MNKKKIENGFDSEDMTTKKKQMTTTTKIQHTASNNLNVVDKQFFCCNVVSLLIRFRDSLEFTLALNIPVLRPHFKCLEWPQRIDRLRRKRKKIIINLNKKNKFQSTLTTIDLLFIYHFAKILCVDGKI